MGPNEVFLTSALAALLLGSPQTSSPSLQSVESFYNRGERTLDQPAEHLESTQLPISVQVDCLASQLTGDSGAKLYSRRIVGGLGTGDELRLYGLLQGQQIDWTYEYDNKAMVQPAHSQAVRWIQDATGLSEISVAELLDVERITVRNWKAGKPIKEAGLRRVLEIRDILQRAQRQYPRRDALVTWLHTPDLEFGISPARLLKQGEFDRARFLAVIAPTTVEPMPAWANRSVPEAWREAFEDLEGPGKFVDALS